MRRTLQPNAEATQTAAAEAEEDQHGQDAHNKDREPLFAVAVAAQRRAQREPACCLDRRDDLTVALCAGMSVAVCAGRRLRPCSDSEVRLMLRRVGERIIIGASGLTGACLLAVNLQDRHLIWVGSSFDHIMLVGMFDGVFVFVSGRATVNDMFDGTLEYRGFGDLLGMSRRRNLVWVGSSFDHVMLVGMFDGVFVFVSGRATVNDMFDGT